MIKKGVLSAIVFLLCLNISFALVGHPASEVFEDGTFPGTQSVEENFTVGQDLNVGGVLYGDGSGLTGLPAGGQWTDASGHIYANNNDTVVVTDDGKVGIGTDNPSEKLDVNGTINIETGNSLTFGSAVAFQREDSPARLEVGQGFNIIELDGNVGIGTASPESKLHIDSGVSDSQIKIGQLGSVDSIWSINDADSAYNDLRIDAGNLLLNSYSSGNVGIGTTSPAVKLDIHETSGAVTQYLTTDSDLDSTLWFGSDRNGDDGGAVWAGIQLDDSDNALKLFKSGGPVNHLVIANGGYVGIGTASPSYKMDVLGNARMGINQKVTVTSNTDIYSSSGYITGDRLNADSLHTNGLGTGQMYIEGAYMDANTVIRIGTGNAGNQGAFDIQLGDNNEIYVDTSTNRVGLGTAGPSSRLDLAGTGQSNGMSFGGGGYIYDNGTAVVIGHS